MSIKNNLYNRLLFIIIAVISLLTTMGMIIKSNYRVQGNLNRLIVDTPVSTTSGTTTVISTQQSTATTTLLPETTLSATPTTTYTALTTIQNTQTPTPPLSGTPTNTPVITATSTPNITNTPGPTETFEPLPSITLLFPVETATQTQESILLGSSSNTQGNAGDSGRVQVARITARSILLIGTVLLLWVILAIFIIFFFRKIGE